MSVRTFSDKPNPTSRPCTSAANTLSLTRIRRIHLYLEVISAPIRSEVWARVASNLKHPWDSLTVVSDRLYARCDLVGPSRSRDSDCSSHTCTSIFRQGFNTNDRTCTKTQIEIDECGRAGISLSNLMMAVAKDNPAEGHLPVRDRFCLYRSQQ